MRSSVVLFSIAATLILAGCGDKTQQASTDPGKKPGAAVKPGLDKLLMDDKVIGKGEAAATGDQVSMRYTGKLLDGTQFDSNDGNGKEPLTFQLGQGAMIKGWDQGIVGMKVGGKRHLSVPYPLGYGDAGRDGIPPKADLYFDVELLDVTKQEDMHSLTIKEMKVGTGPVVAHGKTITVDYVATLSSGAELDSTIKTKKPLVYVFGVDKLTMAFFDTMIGGMKKGGVREATIPSSMATGALGPRVPQGNSVKFLLTMRDVR